MVPTAAELGQCFEPFASWSARDLEAIRAKLVSRSLAPGDVLVAEGDHANAVYLLWEGELAIHLWLRGHAEEVGVLSPGAIAGEVSLMDPGPATATAIACSTVTVLELGRAALEQLYETNPRAAANMMQVFAQVLAGRVRSATERLESMRGMPQSEPAQSRLITALRSLIGLVKSPSRP